jgi:cytochrome c peroxidase
MGRKIRVWIGLLGTMLVLGMFSAALVQPGSETTDKPLLATKTNVAGLSSAFLSWAAGHEANGGDRNVLISLGWSKGMSRELTDASGLVRLDLVNSAAQVKIDGLQPGEWDVWMVESRPGASALPEPNDRMHRLGRVTAGKGTVRLAARLEPGFFSRFHVDTVVVTRAGQRPENAGVLFGSPDLFQRLYTKGRTQPVLQSGHTPVLASLFGPAVAIATPFDSLDPLVAQGEDLFFNERFNGNGRTCGTCHPAENNFTIDPEFIATLPANDPLFVAEFDPNLAQDFEKPQTLRALGLVLENVDGFENLQTKFVLRGVPHTLALRNSRLREAASPAIPAERLGWSGDGAPGAGTLRDFAVGAIIQHFPRTLNRVAGVDFRTPTNDELDAMAAFQLALGRQADLNLATMVFRSPVVERGKAIFNQGDTVNGTVAAGKCAVCHANGGANSNVTGENLNRNIGVELLPDHPADLISPGVRPKDGGFLKLPSTPNGFGNGRFNVPVVVEAADSGPFFHNNAIDTIEGAVEFYNSNAFKVAFGNALATTDTGGIGIHLESTQVEAVAALLRVLNALENIRSSAELDEAAFDVKNPDPKTARLLNIASHDTKDAIRVLQDRSLHPEAVAKLKSAYAKEIEARDEASRPRRNDLIIEILALKQGARSDMLISP